MARRHYETGKCDECGHIRNVTRITFWLNGFKMRVCANCIRQYRQDILKGEQS